MNRVLTPKLRAIWPELVATAALLLTVGGLVRSVTAVSDGHLGYCLDDAYIHLAMAKNLVLHGVWGVTQYEFSSSTSSPLWVLLLAVDFLVRGVNTTAPLLLNLLCGVAVLFVAGAVLRRRGLPQPGILLALLVITFLTPLPAVIFDGMEHVLHILLVFLWIGVLDSALRTEAKLSTPSVVSLCLLASLLTICRFESLALVAITCGILFLRGDRQAAFGVGLCGLASVVVFGAFSLMHGWHALPTSVLVKEPPRDWHSAFHIFESLGGRSLLLSLTAWHITIIIVGAGLCLWRVGPRSYRLAPAALLGLSLATTLVHLQFAQIGWFFRYEAYLEAMGFLVIALAIASLRERVGSWRILPVPPLATAALGLALAAPLMWRGYQAVVLTPKAAKNIYDQQWQMGRFLHENLGTDSVMLGDIGATSFLSDIHLTDLAGLGTLEVADQILGEGGLSRDFVEALAQEEHVQLAVIYDRVFGPMVPSNWKLIGKWKAPDPRITLGDTVVSFYAVNPAREKEFAARLALFSRKLPRDTMVYLPSALPEASASTHQ